MHPGIFIKVGPTDVLDEHLVDLVVQLVAVGLVKIIAQGGGDFHKFKNPVVIGRVGKTTARFIGGKVQAAVVFFPEGLRVKFPGQFHEFSFD